MFKEVLGWFSFLGALVNVYLYGHTKNWGPLTGIVISFIFILYGIVAGIPAAIVSNLLFVFVHYKNLRKLKYDNPA